MPDRASGGFHSRPSKGTHPHRGEIEMESVGKSIRKQNGHGSNLVAERGRRTVASRLEEGVVPVVEGWDAITEIYAL